MRCVLSALKDSCHALLMLGFLLPGTANKVKLSFKLPYRCSFGQELCLVGSGEALGNWSVDKGRRMHWTDGDIWQVDFEVSTG